MGMVRRVEREMVVKNVVCIAISFVVSVVGVGEGAVVSRALLAPFCRILLGSF